MPQWVSAGYEEYAKRFTSPFSLMLCELPAEKRASNTDLSRLKEKEGERLLGSIHPDHQIVALDEKGEEWTTEILAAHLSTWQNRFRGVDFLVGGTEGLSPECLRKAHCQWSLSLLTLPHPLVRIVLAEQLYRATSLLRNHPYHRR